MPPPIAPTVAAPSGSLSPRDGAREALWATALLLLMLLVGKHVVAAVGGGQIIFTAIAAYQLYAPLRLIQRSGELPEAYALHAHGLLLGPLAWLRGVVVRRQRAAHRKGRASLVSRGLALYARGARMNPRALAADLTRAGVVALVTFPPFALLHHMWQVHAGGHYHFAIPHDLGSIMLENTFLIALPEEMFYRGFLEHRLERLWPTKLHVLTLPLSRTVFVASALFALGHFVGEYNPARLAPFFPAFVFSMLVRRGGSLAGAVAYHGASNAFSALLFTGYLNR